MPAFPGWLAGMAVLRMGMVVVAVSYFLLRPR
jgi:hypothetical protein